MSTVFTEMLEQSRRIDGVGAKYVGVALMVASMEQAPQATLPADDGEIAALIDLSVESWEKIKQKVLSGDWELAGGRWVNKSLHTYIGAQRKKPEKEKVARTPGSTGSISFDPSTASFIGADEKRKTAWQKLHPAADIEILLAGLANWLLDNPKEMQKTRNFAKRITNWIKRERVTNPAPMLKDPIKESGPVFMAFWAAYHPARQINFTRAASVWKALGLDDGAEQVMDGLRRWHESREWQDKGGEFVPSPDKWLLAKRWLDSPAAHKQSAVIKDRSGRVVGHDRSTTGRDYGQFGSFGAR